MCKWKNEEYSFDRLLRTQLEEANKALKEKVARAEDTERQKITDLQLTIGLENEALKAKVPNEQIKGERSEKNQIRLQTSI